jgi:hypothetical protein
MLVTFSLADQFGESRCPNTVIWRQYRLPIEATKGTGDNSETTNETPKSHADVNTLEQGDTANIKQNTTNKGFFRGRRVK